MTHKTGPERTTRKSNLSTDAKQPQSPFNLNLRLPKNKIASKTLSRSHKHWTYNRRISG